MTREFHPYGEYLSRQSGALIIGSFPIGKFTHPERKHDIKSHEIDFYYGGEGNQLWKLLSRVFDVDLSSREKIIAFLEENHLSMADVIKSCRRKGGSANDADLYDIEWNTGLRDFIEKNHFKRLYFTSKKVYHWYVKHIGRGRDSDGGRPEEIILLSPSANGLRSIPRMKEYQEWLKTAKVKTEKPTTLFRELFYQKLFKGKT